MGCFSLYVMCFCRYVGFLFYVMYFYVGCHYVMCFCLYVDLLSLCNVILSLCGVLLYLCDVLCLYLICFCRYVQIYAKLSRINAKVSRNNANLFVYIYMRKGDVSQILEAVFVKNHDMLNLYVRFQK